MDENYRLILEALEYAGFETWLVGGCVRDAILGREISDIDIATSAQWQDTKRICEDAGFKIRETGTKHGTVTVINDDGGDYQAFEVTTFRADSPTSSDARHPDSVQFVSSIKEDLARRDFTINAMAWHPERGLYDPYKGEQDLKNKVIRAVGDPKKRFKEDALRILRACRFMSQLGFSLDHDTLAAMTSDKHFLTYVSKERVTHELDLLLMGDHVHDAIMETVDVLSVILPEFVAMKGCEQITKFHIYDVLEHTAWAVQQAAKDRMVRWAALCHDMGKPACAFFDDKGVEHFYGHAVVSARIAEGLMRRFMLSKQFREDVCKLVSIHSDHGAVTKKSVRKYLFKLDGSIDLYKRMLDLNRADILAHAPEYRYELQHIDELEEMLSAVLEEESAFTANDLAIDGNDIIAMGVKPGPGVGRILESALEAVVEGRIENDKDSLMLFARSIAFH